MLTKIPASSAKLIEALNKTVPHRCPDPSMPDREIWIYAGMRKLIDSLLAVGQADTEAGSWIPPE